eukprot:2324289-Amphidinium_carterae.1
MGTEGMSSRSLLPHVPESSAGWGTGMSISVYGVRSSTSSSSSSSRLIGMTSPGESGGLSTGYPA